MLRDIPAASIRHLPGAERWQEIGGAGGGCHSPALALRGSSYNAHMFAIRPQEVLRPPPMLSS